MTYVAERHEMARAGLTDSGAEEWSCLECERRLLLRWPPHFQMLVVVEGDTAAVHAGSKGGIMLSAPEVTQAPSTAVALGERQWLRNNGIDWDDLAS